MKTMQLRFVEHVPEELEEGVLYVSMVFQTVIHKCCCGCGSEVVTPLSPTCWQLTFDGESISLFPSIGSWNLACRSHYWIRNSKVEWAEVWSSERITSVKRRDCLSEAIYFSRTEPSQEAATAAKVNDVTVWLRLKQLWSRCTSLFSRN